MSEYFQSENLVTALNAARSNSIRGIVESKNLTRVDREILQRTGHIRSIMRGWYQFSSVPDNSDSPITPLAFFRFLAIYLDDRLGEKWCFSAQSSLEILLFPEIIPQKLVVTAMYSSTTVKTFPGIAKLTIYENSEAYHPGFEQVNGLRVLPLELAISRLPKKAWGNNPQLIEAALSSLDKLDDITWTLMQEGRQQAASRLADALQRNGRKDEANTLIATMIKAGFPMPTRAIEPPSDDTNIQTPNIIQTDPTLNSLWKQWQSSLTHLMMIPPEGKPPLVEHLANLENLHVQDTIHSLQLSGFHPPEELILDALAIHEKNPQASGWPVLNTDEKIQAADHNQPLPGSTDPMTSLACQGYMDTFKAVKRSIIRLLENEEMGLVIGEDLNGWQQALVEPTTQGGFYPPEIFNTFRKAKPAKILPLRQCSPDAIAEELQNLCILLNIQDSGINKATMANLALHWISPWVTGTGRLARFLMNALLAGSGCDWSIISGDLQAVYGRAVSDALEEGNAGPMAILISNGTVRTPR